MIDSFPCPSQLSNLYIVLVTGMAVGCCLAPPPSAGTGFGSSISTIIIILCLHQVVFPPGLAQKRETQY